MLIIVHNVMSWTLVHIFLISGRKPKLPTDLYFCTQSAGLGAEKHTKLMNMILKDINSHMIVEFSALS